MAVLANKVVLEKAKILLNRFIMGQKEIKCIFAFGSRVKGRFKKDSDLDLGIIFDVSVSFDKALKTCAKLESFLSRELGIEVDVTPLNFSDLLFAYIAIKDAIFMAGDEMFYYTFKSQILRKFFDFKRLLRVHQKRLEELFT